MLIGSILVSIIISIVIQSAHNVENHSKDTINTSNSEPLRQHTRHGVEVPDCRRKIAQVQGALSLSLSLSRSLAPYIYIHMYKCIYIHLSVCICICIDRSTVPPCFGPRISYLQRSCPLSGAARLTCDVSWQDYGLAAELYQVSEEDRQKAIDCEPVSCSFTTVRK